MKKLLLSLTALVLIISTSYVSAQARDYISIVGSSTVYPFAAIAAENFGKSSKFRTPVIESTGSGGGFKLFIAGTGNRFPDITNSSRRIEKSEFEQAIKNRVNEIVEIKIGYDGIVVANSKKAPLMHLNFKDIFLALAAKVPNLDGTPTLVPNPYKTWKSINPDLPDIAIEVLGPPPTSGTRDAFVEMVMEQGASSFEFIKKMQKTDKHLFKSVCHTIREDGSYIEAGENDNLIVQKLNINPNQIGIFGFSFLEQNADKIQGAIIEGIKPEFDAIANGSYSVARSLYVYVKKAHVGLIPGMREFLRELTSDKAWGDYGYMADKGLIPMSAEERQKYAEITKNLIPLKISDF